MSSSCKHSTGFDIAVVSGRAHEAIAGLWRGDRDLVRGPPFEPRFERIFLMYMNNNGERVCNILEYRAYGGYHVDSCK